MAALDHPPIDLLTVLDAVVAQVRTSDQLSDAIDATTGPVNVEGRWFSRRREYLVSLRLDADTLVAAGLGSSPESGSKVTDAVGQA